MGASVSLRLSSSTQNGIEPTRKIEKGDPRITKGDSTGPINTVQVTVDPATGKILR